ncbi:MAG: deoxyribodipyrimidine photo-lyase [Bacteroidales bacterium]|nr:deoxyribodipyrimidine photo-lyase [Bacteroidales bacterium]MDD3431636.1 deoxyribodipyrimidine photo-lyase [Bacteroidales bacterium]MDD4361426.1 deoxyribodipyrimidine photo-lyase [Bacteroidales bacterium]MDD4430289.1 deoxyribodipyrimidine photo-lyase [Bacteroidales bacterium]
MKEKTANKMVAFWFRRDLRLDDNRALQEALNSEFPVLPLFIFDEEILADLPEDDPRLTFIYRRLQLINDQLRPYGSSLYCVKGKVPEVWSSILKTFQPKAVYANEDYEPYAIGRDNKTEQFLVQQGIPFKRCKDQVIFAGREVLKADQMPYTVFTPYKNQWLHKLRSQGLEFKKPENRDHYVKLNWPLPDLAELGFKASKLKVRDYSLDKVDNYHKIRDFPTLDQTTYLSPHLRFGTVSIRQIVLQVLENEAFLSELIWREFFMQILYHFPEVVHNNFKRKYDFIPWRNNEQEFERWTLGLTGYPMVDAGMRQLNATGYMHNRVRMVVAGFLCKHLLIDWRWGEAYFAAKLLDYELSSNNGNWQWAAGTGCDAAPYFRVFNPAEQLRKFDPDKAYVRQWIPELHTASYPSEMLEHTQARERAISTYRSALK